MSLESKMAEARRHLAKVREGEQRRREDAERERVQAARVHWSRLRDAAHGDLGYDLMAHFPADPPEDFRGPDDKGWGGTDDMDVILSFPNLADIHMHFAYRDGKWHIFKPFRGRDTVYLVPVYHRTIPADGDVPAVLPDYDQRHRWHETDDLLLALAYAEEEGIHKRDLEKGLQAWAAACRLDQTRRELERKRNRPEPSDRLLSALRDVIREMLPEV